MNKSVFKISKMDCPSEEQLIRMKLNQIHTVKQLQFSMSERMLTVFHEDPVGDISKVIDELKLGSTLLSSEKIDNQVSELAGNKTEWRTLWTVLLINFAFFVIEMLYGWFSSSMALIADSLDMLADSFVYGLSLMAVGHVVTKKKRVAKLSGYFQALLAIIGLSEVLRRYLSADEMPVFQNMIVVSFFALIANAICFYLIQKAKSDEVHMQASAIFTSNDIIINMGVIIAGALVYFTKSSYPDLIVGLVIFVIVISGAGRILNLSR